MHFKYYFFFASKNYFHDSWMLFSLFWVRQICVRKHSSQSVWGTSGVLEAFLVVLSGRGYWRSVGRDHRWCQASCYARAAPPQTVVQPHMSVGLMLRNRAWQFPPCPIWLLSTNIYWAGMSINSHPALLFWRVRFGHYRESIGIQPHARARACTEEGEAGMGSQIIKKSISLGRICVLGNDRNEAVCFEKIRHVTIPFKSLERLFFQ